MLDVLIALVFIFIGFLGGRFSAGKIDLLTKDIRRFKDRVVVSKERTQISSPSKKAKAKQFVNEFEDEI